MKQRLKLIEEIQSAFAHKERRSIQLLREHATRVAFQIQLSKHHVRLLLWIYEKRKGDFNGMPQERDEGLPDQFISVVRGLERRGLIVHYYADDDKHGGINTRAERKAIQSSIGYYRLTRAGILVAELCTMVQAC